MIAGDLLAYYLPKGYTFGFDKAQKRFGYCLNRPNSTPLISFSKALTELNTEEQFIDTVLHEIAHALTPGANHGRKWKTVAVSIGCNGVRCYGKDVVTPEKPFIGTCPKCQLIIKRFRRKRIACSKCCLKYNHGKFDAQFLFSWKRV